MARYYDVPDLPGVPPLLRDPAVALAQGVGNAVTSFVSPVVGAARGLAGIVTGDLSSLMSPSEDVGGTADASTSWGLFDEDGQQVLFPDSFLGVEYRNSRRISNYPLEQGAFESYNKVNDPFDVVVGMACGGSESNRSAFLATVKALSDDLNLYVLVTPEEVFESVNLERYDYSRKVHNGATLITVNLYFKEIRINTKSEYNSAPDDAVTVDEAAAATTPATSDKAVGDYLDPSEVQNPASASPQSQGQTQAVPASAQQAAPAQNAPVKLPTGYFQDFTNGAVYGPNDQLDPELTVQIGTRQLENALAGGPGN